MTMTDDPAFADRIADALAAEDPAAAMRAALALTVERLGADSGTVHRLGSDGALHLRAAMGIPEPVLAVIETIAVGKGMAGLAVERGEPVTACNIQTDDSGDVRPGARKTGMEGAIVVPILDGERPVGALGVANRAERTFDPSEVALLIEIGRAIARRS